ncbi:MAG: exosortase-associated EpsI family protein [Planctomycetota bacterium]|jgi:hypothetical protein
MSRRALSAGLIWVLAPGLLWLSLYRPFIPSSGRAAKLPIQVESFTMSEDLALSETEFRLLGTNDAVWRSYTENGGGAARMVAVFHQQNWKSVHPPHICLRGSNMEILEDDSVVIDLQSQDLEVGRILARSKDSGDSYLNLYVFGAPGFLSESYLGFFLHHAPLALLRASVGGFLLRVEVWIDPADPSGSEERARRMLAAILPPAQALVEDG